MSIETQQSGTYYSDEDRLTYDMAEVLVDMYLLDDVERSVTRAKHVLNAYDKPCTEHNLLRMFQVLEKRCEPLNPDRSGATRFRIPDEYL